MAPSQSPYSITYPASTYNKVFVFLFPQIICRANRSFFIAFCSSGDFKERRDDRCCCCCLFVSLSTERRDDRPRSSSSRFHSNASCSTNYSRFNVRSPGGCLLTMPFITYKHCLLSPSPLFSTLLLKSSAFLQ